MAWRNVQAFCIETINPSPHFVAIALNLSAQLPQSGVLVKVMIGFANGLYLYLRRTTKTLNNYAIALALLFNLYIERPWAEFKAFFPKVLLHFTQACYNFGKIIIAFLCQFSFLNTIHYRTACTVQMSAIAIFTCACQRSKFAISISNFRY